MTSGEKTQRHCIAVVLVNITLTLAALGAHALAASTSPTRESTFERQKPRLSNWPTPSHDGDLPQA
jgi:hypothetical protein